MSTHEATISWKRTTDEFTYDRYVRDHDWQFGTGSTVRASAASQYRGDASLPNPEEALVAAISSCHMLTFLAIAARRKFVVDRYDDHAVGHLEKNAKGVLAVTRTTLRPRIVFGGDRPPDAADIAQLHHEAHAGCFIANSVTTEITVEPPVE